MDMYTHVYQQDRQQHGGHFAPRCHLSYCASNSYVSTDRSFAVLRMTERRTHDRGAQETREALKIIGWIDINAWSSGKTGRFTDEGGRNLRLSGKTGRFTDEGERNELYYMAIQ